jgi:hypothetical protein
VTYGEDGYTVAHDDWYLWFADADSNAEYAKPEYFLCFLPLNLQVAANRLAVGRAPANWGCSQSGIVRLGRSAQTQFPKDRVVASDPSGLDDWAIVQLDWNYPPYLRSYPDTSSDVQVTGSVVSTPGGFAVRPEYDARQQEGVAQSPPELRLYSEGANRCVIVDTTDPSALVLPSDFSGPVRISVTPRTATVVGSEYFSKPIWVGLRLFTLPDIVTGTAQQIAANSLEEAEHMAEAAGTWNSSAGTLGEGFQPVPGKDPCGTS